MFLLFLFFSIFLFFLYFFIRNKRVRKKQYQDFLNVFGGWKSSMPKLEIGSVYAWSTFKITFQTKEQLEFAERNKLIDDFKNCIKRYYDERFDVDLAISLSYEEE